MRLNWILTVVFAAWIVVEEAAAQNASNSTRRSTSTTTALTTTTRLTTSGNSSAAQNITALACLSCNRQLIKDINVKLLENPSSFDNTCDTTDNFEYCLPGDNCFATRIGAFYVRGCLPKAQCALDLKNNQTMVNLTSVVIPAPSMFYCCDSVMCNYYNSAIGSGRFNMQLVSLCLIFIVFILYN